MSTWRWACSFPSGSRSARRRRWRTLDEFRSRFDRWRWPRAACSRFDSRSATPSRRAVCLVPFSGISPLRSRSCSSSTHGTQFPLYFAVLAIAIGGASFLNASLVVRYGMRSLSMWSLRGICAASLVFSVVAAIDAGHPPLWTLMTYLLVTFFGIGLLFGNLTALAMQPLGHIAGTGAAVVGATSMLISLALGTWIGQSYNGTVLPLVVGFAVLSACSIAAVWWADLVPPGRARPGDAP